MTDQQAFDGQEQEDPGILARTGAAAAGVAIRFGQAALIDPAQGAYNLMARYGADWGIEREDEKEARRKQQLFYKSGGSRGIDGMVLQPQWRFPAQAPGVATGDHLETERQEWYRTLREKQERDVLELAAKLKYGIKGRVTNPLLLREAASDFLYAPESNHVRAAQGLVQLRYFQPSDPSTEITPQEIEDADLLNVDLEGTILAGLGYRSDALEKVNADDPVFGKVDRIGRAAGEVAGFIFGGSGKVIHALGSVGGQAIRVASLGKMAPRSAEFLGKVGGFGGEAFLRTQDWEQAKEAAKWAPLYLWLGKAGDALTNATGKWLGKTGFGARNILGRSAAERIGAGIGKGLFEGSGFELAPEMAKIMEHAMLSALPEEVAQALEAVGMSRYDLVQQAPILYGTYAVKMKLEPAKDSAIAAGDFEQAKQLAEQIAAWDEAVTHATERLIGSGLAMGVPGVVAPSYMPAARRESPEVYEAVVQSHVDNKLREAMGEHVSKQDMQQTMSQLKGAWKAPTAKPLPRQVMASNMRWFSKMGWSSEAKDGAVVLRRDAWSPVTIEGGKKGDKWSLRVKDGERELFDAEAQDFLSTQLARTQATAIALHGTLGMPGVTESGRPGVMRVELPGRDLAGFLTHNGKGQLVFKADGEKRYERVQLNTDPRRAEPGVRQLRLGDLNAYGEPIGPGQGPGRAQPNREAYAEPIGPPQAGPPRRADPRIAEGMAKEVTDFEGSLGWVRGQDIPLDPANLLVWQQLRGQILDPKWRDMDALMDVARLLADDGVRQVAQVEPELVVDALASTFLSADNYETARSRILRSMKVEGAFAGEDTAKPQPALESLGVLSKKQLAALYRSMGGKDPIDPRSPQETLIDKVAKQRLENERGEKRRAEAKQRDAEQVREAGEWFARLRLALSEKPSETKAAFPGVDIKDLLKRAEFAQGLDDQKTALQVMKQLRGKLEGAQKAERERKAEIARRTAEEKEKARLEAERKAAEEKERKIREEEERKERELEDVLEAEFEKRRSADEGRERTEKKPHELDEKAYKEWAKRETKDLDPDKVERVIEEALRRGDTKTVEDLVARIEARKGGEEVLADSQEADSRVRELEGKLKRLRSEMAEAEGDNARFGRLKREHDRTQDELEDARALSGGLKGETREGKNRELSERELDDAFVERRAKGEPVDDLRAEAERRSRTEPSETDRIREMRTQEREREIEAVKRDPTYDPDATSRVIDRLFEEGRDAEVAEILKVLEGGGEALPEGTAGMPARDPNADRLAEIAARAREKLKERARAAIDELRKRKADEQQGRGEARPEGDSGTGPVERGAGEGDRPADTGERGGASKGTSRVGDTGESRRLVVAREKQTHDTRDDWIPPDIHKGLRPHQAQGTSKAVQALERVGGFLLGDGPGAGKTRQILASAAIYNRGGVKVAGQRRDYKDTEGYQVLYGTEFRDVQVYKGQDGMWRAGADKGKDIWEALRNFAKGYVLIASGAEAIVDGVTQPVNLRLRDDGLWHAKLVRGKETVTGATPGEALHALSEGLQKAGARHVTVRRQSPDSELQDLGAPRAAIIIAPKRVAMIDWDARSIGGSYKADADAMGLKVELWKGTDGKPFEDGKTYLTTYENLDKALGHIKSMERKPLVIFDEAHYLKNASAARSNSAMELIETAHGLLYATATSADKPQHLMYLARAGIFDGLKTERQIHDKFKDLGMIVRADGGWHIPSHIGYKGMLERVEQYFEHLTEQGLILKREISFEGTKIEVQPIELSRADLDMVQKHLTPGDYVEVPPGWSVKTIEPPDMPIRRHLELAKVPHIVERTMREIADGRHVVIFTERVNESRSQVVIKNGKGDSYMKELHFTESPIEVLKAQLRERGVEDIVEVHGNSPRRIQDDVATFQENKARVLIASISKGSEGINLDNFMGGAPRSMIIATAPFGAVPNIQALGRIWRLNTQGDARFIYVYAPRVPTEQWNLGIVFNKMRMLGATMGGEVGKITIDPTEWLRWTGKEDPAERGDMENPQRSMVRGQRPEFTNTKADAAEASLKPVRSDDPAWEAIPHWVVPFDLYREIPQITEMGKDWRLDAEGYDTIEQAREAAEIALRRIAELEAETSPGDDWQRVEMESATRAEVFVIGKDGDVQAQLRYGARGVEERGEDSPVMSADPIAAPGGGEFATNRNNRFLQVDTTTSDYTNVDRVREAWQDLHGAPIRSGRQNFARRGALGWFKGHEHLIENKKARDMAVMAHESGHAFMGHLLELRTKTALYEFADYPARVADELETLGRHAYGERKPGKGFRHGYPAEGWAEFVARLSMDKWAVQDRMERIQDTAPEAYKWFMEKLQAKPELYQKFLAVKRHYDIWNDMGFRGRLDSHFASERSDGSFHLDLNPVRAARAVRRAFEDNIIDLFVEEKAWERKTGKKLKPTDSAYTVLTAMGQQPVSIAREMMSSGTRDMNGKINGEGFKQAVENITIKEWPAFMRYLLSLRHLTLIDKKIRGHQAIPEGAGIALQDALSGWKEGKEKPHFVDAAKRVDAFFDRVLQYSVESGALRSEDYKRIKKLNPFYIPLLRVFDGSELASGSGMPGSGLTRGLSASRKIRGSDRRVEELVFATLQTVQRVVTASIKARTVRAMVNVMRGLGDYSDVIRSIEPSGFKLQARIEDIKAQLKKAGIDVDQIESLTGEPVDVEALVSLYGIDHTENSQKPMVTAYIDGKLQHFEITNPDVYRAMQEIGGHVLRPIDKIARLFVSPVRLGAVALSMPFAIANSIFRDPLSAAWKTKHGWINRLPLINQLVGMANLMSYAHQQGRLRKGKIDLEQFNESEIGQFFGQGGNWTGFVHQESGVNRGQLLKEMQGWGTADHLLALALMKKGWFSSVSEMVKRTQDFIGKGEMLPRINEYKNAMKWADHQKDWSDADKALYALLHAKDVTNNYSRGGVIANVFNHWVPFFRAGLAGKSKTLRSLVPGLETAMGPRKSGVASAVGAMSGLLSTMVAVYTLPALLEWWLGKDDPEWQQRRNSDLFYHFRIGDGAKEFTQIPKDYGPGKVFGTIPVHIIEGRYKNDPGQVGEDIMNALVELLSPFEGTPVPQILRIPLELESNYNFFQGRSIVPEYKLRMNNPEMIYYKWTTETAKAMGRLIGMSPVHIEHAISQATGGMGMELLRVLEFPFGDKEKDPDPANAPIVGRFLTRRNPFAYDNIDRVYETRERLTKLKNDWKVMADEARKRGEAPPPRTLSREDAAMLDRANAAADQLSDLRKRWDNERVDADTASKRARLIADRALREGAFSR